MSNDDILAGWTFEVELDIPKLQGLAIQVDKIMREEIEKFNISYDFAEARIYNCRTVGVQGDKRSYGLPAEITLYKEGHMAWNTDFLERLSTRITNEVHDINRVVYVLKTKAPDQQSFS